MPTMLETFKHTSRSTCYLEGKKESLREMKLAHRNYLGLNARRPVSGFTTMQDSNQPAQLQRVHVAKKLKFCV